MSDGPDERIDPLDGLDLTGYRRATLAERLDGSPMYVREDAHEAVPVPGTVRVAEGPDAGQPAPLDSHRPVEADCRCGGTIRRETWVPIGAGGEWRHTEVRHAG